MLFRILEQKDSSGKTWFLPQRKFLWFRWVYLRIEVDGKYHNISRHNKSNAESVIDDYQNPRKTQEGEIIKIHPYTPNKNR